MQADDAKARLYHATEVPPKLNGQGAGSGSGSPIVVSAEKRAASLLAAFEAAFGPSESVRRFARKYGNPRTAALYLQSLWGYVSWLRGQGIQLSPDDLVEDNLRAVYESKATDVKTKRRHRGYIDRYINDFLLKRGLREATRVTLAAAISQFYIRNDSPLFGDFSVSSARAVRRSRPRAS